MYVSVYVCVYLCVCVYRPLCLYVAVRCVFSPSCSRREQAGSPGAIVPVAATWQEVSRSFQLQHLLWCPFGEESARKKGCVNLVCLYTRFIWHQMKYLRRYLTLLVTGSKPGFSVATPFLMPIWKRKYPEERLDEPCLPIYMIHMASYEVS